MPKPPMICKITYHGAANKPSIRVGSYYREHYFREKNKIVKIRLDGLEGFTTLQPDFFSHVGQIRAIYPTKEYVNRGTNLLIDWINANNIKIGDKVELEIITPFKEYSFRKVTS